MFHIHSMSAPQFFVPPAPPTQLDMEEFSFQDLLLPLTQIEHTLCRLRDLLWHINSIADILETLSAEAMRKASGQVTAAINHHERLSATSEKKCGKI